MSTAWSQGIIHVVPSPPIYYSPLPSFTDLDLNGDGTTDYSLTSDGNTINIIPRNLNSVVSMLEPPPDMGALVVPLAQGKTISSSLDPMCVWYGASTDPVGATTIISCMNIGCIGYWQNVNAYAGLQMTVSNQTYHGWLHIENVGIQAGQLIDWAYSTSPNTPIIAGAVPEPSISSLLLMGLGVFAMRHLPASSRAGGIVR